MSTHLFTDVLQVIELSRASKNYTIVLSIPKDDVRYKAPSFWALTTPLKPMIIEFDLNKIPKIYEKIGFFLVILDNKKEEEVFKQGAELFLRRLKNA